MLVPHEGGAISCGAGILAGPAFYCQGSLAIFQALGQSQLTPTRMPVPLHSVHQNIDDVKASLPKEEGPFRSGPTGAWQRIRSWGFPARHEASFVSPERL